MYELEAEMLWRRLWVSICLMSANQNHVLRNNSVVVDLEPPMVALNPSDNAFGNEHLAQIQHGTMGTEVIVRTTISHSTWQMSKSVFRLLLQSRRGWNFVTANSQEDFRRPVSA